MKTTKRILSLILAVIMLISVVPISAVFGIDAYRIYFYDFDDQILFGSLVQKGTSPSSIVPFEPLREYNDVYHYVFEGWYDIDSEVGYKTEELPIVTKDTRYRAVYSAESHWYGSEVIVPPTCKTSGQIFQRCTVCGVDVFLKDIPPIDHILDENTISTVAPTCTSPGWSMGVCKMCGDSITTALPASGKHTLRTIVGSEPTCTLEGYTSYNECTRCDYAEIPTKLPALGHIDNDYDSNCDRCNVICRVVYTEDYYTYTVVNNKAIILSVAREIAGDVVIPSTLGGYPVTVIGENAFCDCHWLTEITVPETVKIIEDTAFSYCVALKEVVIAESVTSIGDYAFGRCMSLERIIFKNSSVDIGDYVGYTDMLIKEGHTLDEWLNKFYKIADAELNGGADDALYEDILAITILCEDIVVNPILNIYGYEPSTAHTFAIANGMPFKNIGEYFKNDLDISTGVEVVYPTDAFDAEVDLLVNENGENANIVISSIFTKYKSYDISFEAEGLKVQPNAKVTVKLPIPEGYNKALVYVYYIDDIGSKTKLDSRVEKGFIIFETDHFSEYVIVDESSKIEAPVEPEVPDESETPEEPAKPCTCNCHAGGIKAFFFKLINFFAKLFNPAKRICACGVKH